ncbi:MAG: hypothetical protein IKQ55_03610 [Kiritimatiellae bacterium]|nr:hypothetical protein [Kiritimatiellia bacterium]
MSRPIRPTRPTCPPRPLLLLASALLLTLPTGCALWHRGPTHKAVDELEAKQHSAPRQEISTKRTGLIQRTEIRSSSYP